MVDDPYYARLRAGQSNPAVLAVLMEEPALVTRMTDLQLAVADAQYVPPAVEVVAAAAPGPHGPVPVRVYLPSAGGQGLRPLFVWVHGGGWVEGDLDMGEADHTAREVSERAGAVVVSVDYRLAGEGVHYPVPLDDVVAAWRWSLQSAAAWRADPARAVLGGASAGGNLAAGAALRLQDEGGPDPMASARANRRTGSRSSSPRTRSWLHRNSPRGPMAAERGNATMASGVESSTSTQRSRKSRWHTSSCAAHLKYRPVAAWNTLR